MSDEEKEIEMAQPEEEVEGGEVADESGVVTLTLNDVLEFEDEVIENTAAVLGAANDKSCSYSEVSNNEMYTYVSL